MNSPIDVEITPRRLEELVRWHGTDESDLPPTHTLQNLSRDTVAALWQLRQSRERIERLRAAMGRAFWAADARELHAILLEALGPPPAACDDPTPRDHCAAAGGFGGAAGTAGAAAREWPATGTPS